MDGRRGGIDPSLGNFFVQSARPSGPLGCVWGTLTKLCRQRKRKEKSQEILAKCSTSVKQHQPCT
ncbi:hypothetical protein ACS0TY_018054 [Phlomoides rotata]